MTNMDSYRFKTVEPHIDNIQTMNDYLDNHLSESFEVVLTDGTYAEIENRFTGERFAVHAGGDGDSFNHLITFEEI